MQLSPEIREELEGRVVALAREVESYREDVQRHAELASEATRRIALREALRAEYDRVLGGGF